MRKNLESALKKVKYPNEDILNKEDILSEEDMLKWGRYFESDWLGSFLF